MVYQGGISIKQIISPVHYITKALLRQSLKQNIYIKAVGPIRQLIHQSSSSTQTVISLNKYFFICVRGTLLRRLLYQIDYSIKWAVFLKNYHHGGHFFYAFILLGVKYILCLFYYFGCSDWVIVLSRGLF